MISLIFFLFACSCLLAAIDYLIAKPLLQKMLVVAMAAILIAVASTRPIGVDQDSVGYYMYYGLERSRMALTAEPSFVLIAEATRNLFAESGFRWLLLAYASLGVTIKFLAIRKLTVLIWPSIIIYLSQYFLLHEMTQIRAGVAAGCVLLAVHYAYHRKVLVFLALVATASLFHYSALVAFPLIFLRRRLSVWTKIAIALAIPVGIVVQTIGLNFVYVLPIELVENKVDTYTSSIAYNSVALNVFNAVYLVKYLLLYLFLLFSDKIASRSPYFPMLIQMYALSMLSYLALSYNAAFAIRVSELFGIVEVILIPLLIYGFRIPVVGAVAVIAIAAGNLALSVYESELIRDDGLQGQ